MAMCQYGSVAMWQCLAIPSGKFAMMAGPRHFMAAITATASGPGELWHWVMLAGVSATSANCLGGSFLSLQNCLHFNFNF